MTQEESQSDELLGKIFRAQVATMNYAQALAWTGVFLVIQIVMGAVLWLAFLVSNPYDGPPGIALTFIALIWFAGSLVVGLSIGSAMREATKSRESV